MAFVVSWTGNVELDGRSLTWSVVAVILRQVRRSEWHPKERCGGRWRWLFLPLSAASAAALAGCRRAAYSMDVVSGAAVRGPVRPVVLRAGRRCQAPPTASAAGTELLRRRR